MRAKIAPVFLATLLAAQLALYGTSEPTFVVSPAVVDLGNLPVGADARGVVRVSNPGRTVVHLDGPSVSCGCLVPTLAERSLPAGSNN